MSNSPINSGRSLVSIISDRLKVTYLESRPHPAFVSYKIDLTHVLRLGGMEEVKVVDTTDPSVTDEDTYQAFRELLTRPDWRYVIKLMPLRGVTSELLAKFRRFENTAILLEDDFAALTKSKSILPLLRDLLRRQIDISLLSPYQTAGAVTGARFVGRTQQLSAIMKHPEKSYLVTGIRMSGKTSLLQEAKRRILLADDGLEEADSSVAPKVIYVDCKKYATVAGFINGILTEMQDRSSFASIERWQSPNRWYMFYNYLRTAAKLRPDKRLHFFLDEYDSVVEFDRRDSSRITWNFRALQQTNSIHRGIIQFVFAGSKALASLARNKDSDFFNFVEPNGCLLHNFEIGEVKQLVEQPLEDIGLSMEDPALIAAELLNETGGHPATVQYVCSQIVMQLRKLRLPILKSNLINTITHSADFYHHFEGILFENLDLLEDFILRVVSKDLIDGPSFSQEYIVGILRRDYQLTIDGNLLYLNLDDLRNSGFLKLDEGYHGERYEITVPVIKRIFRPKQPRDLIPRLLETGMVNSNRKG